MTVVIDGSYGEGGGQILRTAVALSAVTLKPVRVFNIRAKRPKPGLQPQHLAAVKAAALMTKADVSGLYVGSTELSFRPREIRSGSTSIDVGTAGSISLVLQSLLPALAFAPSQVKLEITGGTDVSWSPPIDYVSNVLLPTLAKMGYCAKVSVLRRGHYPRGGGRVLVEVNPVGELRAIKLLEAGGLSRVEGISHCVKLPRHVASRQAEAARRALQLSGISNINIREEFYPPSDDPHLGPGSGVVLWALTSTDAVLGADALGAPGKPAEKVGEEAATKLLQELSAKSAVDSHMGDMLVPYMALATGRSEVKVSKLTLHAQTAMAVVEKFLDVEFEVDGGLDKTSRISVSGAGLKKG